MGSEFGQWREWRDQDQLDWNLLAEDAHRGLQSYVRELNHLYLRTPQFFQSDCDGRGFHWIDLHNADESVWAFERRSTAANGPPPVLCIFNATPVPRTGYLLRGVAAGRYRKILDGDAAGFGGSGFNAQDEVTTDHAGDGQAQGNMRVDLPPLAAMFFTS
jgi:1,4-alpha-glucan branching enzyme